jgi:hypothetical protein
MNTDKLKIALLFVVIFCMSFIPEWWPELFGDWHCNGGINEWQEGPDVHEGCSYNNVTHAPTWHWGYRHWIWMFAGLTMTIWTVVDIIIKASKDK